MMKGISTHPQTSVLSGGLAVSRGERDLNLLAERVENALARDEVPAGRRVFFEALRLLQLGQIDQAIVGFRRAARVCGAPFDSLALVALGQCEYNSGHEASALRQWQRVGEDESAPRETRLVAWLSVATLAEQRRDVRLARRASAAWNDLDAAFNHRDPPV